MVIFVPSQSGCSGEVVLEITPEPMISMGTDWLYRGREGVSVGGCAN